MTPPDAAGGRRPFTAFFVVGEESGDQLGAGLIKAFKELLGDDFRPAGLGGAQMTDAGLKPLFPLGDMAVMGFTAVASRVRKILARIEETAKACLEIKPDVLVLVDSPEFTHRVGKAVRRVDPSIPVIDYVSPTIWAWRQGRARKMKGHIDHVLAVLPFEPALYERLGGPPCTYVGHPLLEKVPDYRPHSPGERPPLSSVDKPTLLVLPGSRYSETKRLMKPFGAALAEIVAKHGPVEALLPAVPHLEDEIEKRMADWPVKPQIIRGEAAKNAAFRRAHAALACSGTVSLELALAGVPMAIAYKIDYFLRPLKFMVRIPTVVLANVVLGDMVIPEFLDGQATPKRLARATLPLLSDTPERRRQVEAFGRLDDVMAFEGGRPTIRAVEKIFELVGDPRRKGRRPAG